MPLAKYSRHKEWLVFLSAAGVFAYLLHLSWFRWGDLVVDTGREIYAPLRICIGDRLYRDFYYIYGPFSPYFNAIFFKALGIRLSSLILSGALAAAAAGLLVYKLSRIFLGIFSSALVLLTFFIVFAFGQYVYYGNYNFIIPYSYGAIHALIFALAAAYFFYGWLRAKPGYGFLTGLFITLTLLSKIEVGGSALAACAFTGMLAVRPRYKPVFYFAAVPLFIFALVYLLFSLRPDSLSAPLTELMNAARPGASIPAWLSGAGNIRENSLIIIRTFGYYLGLTAFFALGGYIIYRVAPKGSAIASPSEARAKQSRFFEIASSRCALLAMTIAAAIIAAGLFFIKKFFPFDWQYRSLPLILPLVIYACLIGLERQKNKERKEKTWALLCLCVLSFLLITRIFFTVRPAHYGFYLLVPGMVCYYVLFLDVLPRLLPAAVNRAFFRLAFAAVFIFFINGHFGLSRFCYLQKRLKVTTPSGTIYAFNNSREDNLRRLIGYLRNNTPAESTLVVFPEGPMINYLSQRFNPLYYCMYMPLDLNKPGVTERVLNDMEKYKIDYVVLAQRLGDEQGYPVFGLDYGRPVWEYIKENYLLLKLFGPFPFTTPDYGIALFVRRSI